jgi:phenylacetate-coenzyme A ligase PaaK-like adenylate-forming protein
MSILKNLLEIPPFSISSINKRILFRSELQRLTLHHYTHCSEYRRIIERMGIDPRYVTEPDQVPFLPVGIFKKYSLSSLNNSAVVSTLKSSGTTGQRVSQIVLDKEAATNQKRVLTNVTADFIGKSRLPMLILDSNISSTTKDRAMFSARRAGILGFSNFGFNLTYAFDDEMNLDIEVVQAFLDRHSTSEILLFGFTFMVWQHFVMQLKEMGKRLALDNGILIHGGGWKKLQNLAVDSKQFKETVQEVSGIKRIHNYYGMAEQAGSIFMECDQGHFHCSIFSDILIRRNDFSLCNIGESGLIEVLSLLPHSYPGHVLLTEDLGTLLGEDDCLCGRLGKYFTVNGRIEQAEIRGCSDAYQQ